MLSSRLSARPALSPRNVVGWTTINEASRLFMIQALVIALAAVAHATWCGDIGDGTGLKIELRDGRELRHGWLRVPINGTYSFRSPYGATITVDGKLLGPDDQIALTALNQHYLCIASETPHEKPPEVNWLGVWEEVKRTDLFPPKAQVGLPCSNV
jgi:hypothetical protein